MPIQHSPDNPPHIFAWHRAAWQQIAPHVRYKTVDKGDTIINHGDSANILWLVLRGWAKLTRQTPDGKEVIVGLCTGDDVFGETALFPDNNYPYHAEIIADGTELAMIPAEVMRNILAKDTVFSSHIMSMLNERVEKTQLKLEQMSTMSAAQRLGCFLLRLCDQSTNNSHTLQIPVEKHLLATYLGMKPETFSRSQQQLKTHGITISGHQVKIDSVSKLREFACNSCSGSCV